MKKALFLSLIVRALCSAQLTAPAATSTDRPMTSALTSVAAAPLATAPPTTRNDIVSMQAYIQNGFLYVNIAIAERVPFGLDIADRRVDIFLDSDQNLETGDARLGGLAGFDYRVSCNTIPLLNICTLYKLPTSTLYKLPTTSDNTEQSASLPNGIVSQDGRPSLSGSRPLCSTTRQLWISSRSRMDRSPPSRQQETDPDTPPWELSIRPLEKRMCGSPVQRWTLHYHPMASSLVGTTSPERGSAHLETSSRSRSPSGTPSTSTLPDLTGTFCLIATEALRRAC